MILLCRVLEIQQHHPSVSCRTQTATHQCGKPLLWSSLTLDHLKNVKNLNQHMPFITIIGVIKVGHLWAKCNAGLAGFFYFTAPLVFKYTGLKALRHLDPCDPPSPPPQTVLSLPHSALLWLSAQSKATSPYF